MRELLNGCSCSKLSVHPRNWKGSGASIKKDWYIFYTFIDPAFKEKYKYGKLVFVKGMNRSKTLEERRAITKVLLDEIEKIIYDEGYNPISKTFMVPPATSGDILPTTLFPRACELAREMLKCKQLTKNDIKSALTYIEKSAIALQLNNLQVQQIRRKHISLILDNCKNVKDYWSPHLFNHYCLFLI